MQRGLFRRIRPARRFPAGPGRARLSRRGQRGEVSCAERYGRALPPGCWRPAAPAPGAIGPTAPNWRRLAAPNATGSSRAGRTRGTTSPVSTHADRTPAQSASNEQSLAHLSPAPRCSRRFARSRLPPIRNQASLGSHAQGCSGRKTEQTALRQEISDPSLANMAQAAKKFDRFQGKRWPNLLESV